MLHKRCFTQLCNKQLLQGVLKNDRGSIAKAITLVESTCQRDQEQAQQLLTQLLTQKRQGFRIGITGSPGVGKSTLIETFGLMLCEKGHLVSVLAVDPSSKRSGGSILGDKTRMPLLSVHDRAFIRGSPSGLTLGGVAQRTLEALVVVESAGYDVCIVETVGVGQTETTVADMVDMFVLLVGPGGGDELQGLKKGIAEEADMVLVNKADGELLPAARLAQTEYRSAFKFYQQKRPVLLVSAMKGTGIEDAWEKMQDFKKLGKQKRKEQQVRWMWRILHERMDRRLHEVSKEWEEQVKSGTITPTVAANAIQQLIEIKKVQ